MEPRRKTNKINKSTSLPAEYLENVRHVVKKAFKQHLKGMEIFVEGRLYPDELILCVGYCPEGIRQVNFEASSDHKGRDILDKLGLCLDALSSLMLEHFENSDLELPLEWTEYDFAKKKLFLKTSGRNTELENQANELLGVDPNDALIIEPVETSENGEASNTTEARKPSKEDSEYARVIEEVNEKLNRKRH